jgi:hypothetical protein
MKLIKNQKEFNQKKKLEDGIFFKKTIWYGY